MVCIVIVDFLCHPTNETRSRKECTHLASSSPAVVPTSSPCCSAFLSQASSSVRDWTLQHSKLVCLVKR